MDKTADSTHAIVLPVPSGTGELHALNGEHGRVVDETDTKTTNRAYFDVRGPLELTAAECRQIASALEEAATQLDEHHDVRMPIDGDEAGETHD